MSLFVIMILAWDFAISIWNAYASGLNQGFIENLDTPNKTFWKISVYVGLGEAYAGMTYVLTILFSWIAYSLQHISAQTFQAVLSLNFIVFGFLIIGFGLVITVQSIVIALERRDWKSIGIALYNTFAEIWDIVNYVESFKEAVGFIKEGGGKKDGRAAMILIIIAAMLIAFFITHAAYIHGYKKAASISVSN